MSDSSYQSAASDASGPRAGERLAAARRAHEISATDIAKELHLDERKIRALEQNDFSDLGAPVFAKGHLRKYAELVGVPVDDVIADYYELNRSAGAPPVVGPVRKIPRDFSPGPWLTGTVIILIVLGIAYWWFTRGAALPLTQTTSGNLRTFVSEPIDAQRRHESGQSSDIVSAVPGEVPETAAGEVISSERGSQADAVAEAPLPVPQVELELVFSGECWTEVTDASGRVLFYDLGREGRAITLAGDEPLQIVLGDSDNVHLAVDGQDYPIPDSARRGRMARLTITRQ